MDPHSSPKALAQHLMVRHSAHACQTLPLHTLCMQTALPCQHRTPEGLPAVLVASTLLASRCADMIASASPTRGDFSQPHIASRCRVRQAPAMACYKTHFRARHFLHAVQAGKSPKHWSAAWQPPRIAEEA